MRGRHTLTGIANGVTTTYAYDLNGNMASKATGTSTVRYHWDDEDEMVNPALYPDKTPKFLRVFPKF